MDLLAVTHLPFRENESFFKHFTDGPKRDKGQLFLQIDLADNPGAEDAISEKIWRALHDNFFNCESDDQYYCFEEALKAANEVLIQESKKRENGSIGKVHAIASLLDGNNLHFAQTGQASVFLKRGEYFSQISEDLDTEAEKSFASISSGDLAPGDGLIYTTRPLNLDDATLLEAFSVKDSKIPGQLKSLAKKKDYIGQITYYFLPAPDEAEAPAKEAKESGKTVEDKMNEIEKELSAKDAKGRKKSHKKISAAGLAAGEKVKKTKDALKGVFAGVGSRFFKIAKKPERLKKVNRRYVLLTVIAFIILLAILLTLQSGYRQQADQAQYYEDLLSQANNNIAIAENRFLIGEKTDATDFLNKAGNAVKEIEDAGFFQSEVSKLNEQILLFRDHFDRIARASDLNVFADLSEKGTVDALGIINTADQKNFIYEPRRLFETLLSKVQDPLTIDTEEIVLAGTELQDFNVLSFITQAGQVIEYETRNGRFELAKTLDDTWHKGVDVKSFNGDFMYILDPPSNTIWKYRRLRTAYGNATVYTSEGDLSNAVSIAIDGDIYALLRDGTILKYRKGGLLPLEIKEQPSIPLENPTRIFTLAEHNNIYVLDSKNKRIVVYSKGQNNISTYERQVLFDSLEANEIRDFVVDKDEQKILVLTADKVYIADL